MTNLTVRNGRTAPDQSGAGIRSFGTLTLSATTFTGNTATADPATNNCDPSNVCPAP